MVRTHAAWIPYLVALALVVGGVLWREGDHVAGLGRTVESGMANVGGPFALIDQTGAKRTADDFHGRYMLVYFGYRLCPDVCPTTLAVMADALDKLGGNKARVIPIFVTVDPQRDTPQALKSYLKSFGPNFVGLTGSPQAIAAAARAYRVYYAKHLLPGGGYSMDHSSVIVLMGPDGRFMTFYDADIGPDAIAADLRKRL